ncbi:MAG TPA: RHS repeat-associated core domain-containing protein, partial [Streptosporangiaceae bacterium]|nr:RHS repeat-associated core domain-containing protein [Streptosporangiaceae bacterium]
MSQMLPEIFDALGGDAARAIEDAAGADARFFERTAANEDTALARIAENERQLTRQAESIGQKASQDAGEAAGLDSSAGAATPGGDNPGLIGAASDAGAASRPADEIPSAGDPVDVATGDVFLAQVDVTLPGVLPLVLGRVHRSSWRAGRWFGRSWMSSFDQRLLITAGRVIGAFADGRVLTWADLDGSDGTPWLPVTGPAWPLRRNTDDSYTVTDPQQGLTWRFERRPGYDGVASPGGEGELPLVALSDRAGHQITFGYDLAGRPVSVSHSGGYQIRVTVAGGHVTGLALGERGDLPLLRYEYDEDGDLVAVVNSSGQPLRFSYDAEGRLAGWADRNERSYGYSYDDQGRCVRAGGSGGALSGTFSYQPGLTRWTDATGAVTSYELTSSSRVAAITDPLGNVTRWQYDARGRVTARVDALDRVTRCGYDDRGNLVTIVRPDGSEAHAEYDERCQAVRLTGPDGTGWQQEFDSRGNRTQLVAPDGSITRYSYDDRGHLTAMTGPDGAVTAVACDAAGLPIEVTGPDGARTSCQRDQFGRVARFTGPGGAVTSLTWTIEGQLSSRTLPDGATETWSWDGEGNLTRHVSEAGAVTRYEYGPFDRPVAVWWPDGTRSQFSYDHQLRPTQVVHGGLTWRYDYDPAGRLIAETDYNGATTTYVPDPAGQLTQRVNAAGQRLAFRYDVLGSLIERSADGAVTTFGYDPAGRLVHARNADAEIRFDRDKLGRVTAETCNGRTLRSQYDEAGRITHRVTPSGVAATWEYDQAGQPVLMTAGRHELRFGYDPAGREIHRELPGGLTLTQDWDLSGRLVAQALTGPRQLPEGPGQLLQRRAYTYRADGFPTGVEDLMGGHRTLSLDPAGRVTAVTGATWAERYAYDPAGNLTSATWPVPPPGPATAWLDTGPQGQREFAGTLITRAGDIRYRHDRAGRVVSRQRVRISRKPETWNYQWDADDRLVAVTTPDGTTWSYRYDPLGRRIAKQRIAPGGQPSELTEFAWDGAVLAEQAVSTPQYQRITTWTHQPGTFTPVAQAERTTLRDAPQDQIDQRFYAIITDLAAVPSELTAPDGTLAGHQQHTLWGGTVWNGADTPLRFPGQYADPETGLHYNNQRYYDPTTGRYLTCDPLGLAPTPNPYTYVRNPYISADPLGLAPCG